MAKCCKVTMYMLDLNGSPRFEEELRSTIECNKYPEFKHVEKIEVADIGEWGDDHELNKRGADYEKYFREEKYGEIRK
jgi:hypothetical protein